MVYYPIDKTLPAPIPNLLELAEDAILEQLAPLKEVGIAVTAWPSKHEDFGRAYPNGLVLVAYESAKWEKPMVTDIIEQEQLDTWTLSVGVKNLRTHKGVYAVLQAIKMLLTGFRPPNYNQLFPLEEGFVRLDTESRIWEYQIKFGVPKLHIQSVGEEVLPLLKSINFESVVTPYLSEFETFGGEIPIENITFTEG